MVSQICFTPFGNIPEVMHYNLSLLLRYFNVYYCSNKEKNLSKKAFLQLTSFEACIIEVKQYC